MGDPNTHISTWRLKLGFPLVILADLYIFPANTPRAPTWFPIKLSLFVIKPFIDLIKHFRTNPPTSFISLTSLDQTRFKQDAASKQHQKQHQQNVVLNN